MKIVIILYYLNHCIKIFAYFLNIYWYCVLRNVVLRGEYDRKNLEVADSTANGKLKSPAFPDDGGVKVTRNGILNKDF